MRTPRAEISGQGHSRQRTSPHQLGTTRHQSKRRGVRWRHYLLLASIVAGQPFRAAAQTHDVEISSAEPETIRWWQGAIVLGGLSGLMLLDQTTQKFVQDNRSATGNRLAENLRRFGQPEVYGSVTLGLLGAGVLSGNDDLTRAGARLATTLALAGAASSLTKLAIGRPRPSESLDADTYVPFSGREAMPSGHTTIAFALATALADDIQRTWASVGLYTLATGVAWSRVNDNRHWLSDVASGAVLGITSAKLVNGNWRIFNLRPPSILLGPRQATVAWRLTF